MQYEKNNDRDTLFEPTMGSGGTVADASKLMRLGFIRKVYGILSIQLLATMFVCVLAMKLTAADAVGDYKVLSFGTFLAASFGFRIFIFIFSLIVMMGLFCFANKYPLNMAVLAVWTIAMSMSVAAACSSTVCDPLVRDGMNVIPNSISSDPYHLPLQGGVLQCAIGTPHSEKGGNAVIMAAGITAIIFFSLTAFTMQSKWDFSFLGAGLGVALMCLFLWGIGLSIFGGGANIMYLYSLAGAVIFSLYIVFDTWLITQKFGPDDYIIAAISLYLDIINLFLFILSLLRSND